MPFIVFVDFGNRNKSIAFLSPFTSPKERSPITTAETRHSAAVSPYHKVDGAKVGLQPLLGPSTGGVESERLQTLLPNIRKGGGGALVRTRADQEMGGVGGGRYGDAIDMIEKCIDQARKNVTDIQTYNQENEEDDPVSNIPHEPPNRTDY